jgi:hypothetical protein
MTQRYNKHKFMIIHIYKERYKQQKQNKRQGKARDTLPPPATNGPTYKNKKY